MKSILVLIPYMGIGGAQALAAWKLNTLQHEFKVSLATFDRHLDFDIINKCFGTDLLSNRIKHISIPHRKSILFSKSIYYRQKLISRFARTYFCKFDLYISAYGHMDLPSPAICYILFPQFKKTPTFVRNAAGMPDSLLRKLSRTFFDIVFYTRKTSPFYCCTSAWTSKYILQAWGVSARVLYPPALTKNVCLSNDEKQLTQFICISRCHPEKEIEFFLESAHMLHKKFPDLVFHWVAGKKEFSPYYKSLKTKYLDDTDFIRVYFDLSVSKLHDLLSKCAYGIHPKNGEHFGIAVAEMVHFGVIPFVRSTGGQIEIVNNIPDLVCCSVDALVENFTALNGDPVKSDFILSVLHNNSFKFTTSYFSREFTEIVNLNLS